MKNLKRMYELLKSKKEKGNVETYYIPEIWQDINGEDKEIKVNPYSFFCDLLEKHVFTVINNKYDYLKSVGNNKSESSNGDWIKRGNIYALNVRTATAYSHNKLNVEGGSFLKAIALIPLLKYIKIDSLYLLPIFELGSMHKKGELGSIYCIKNFYKINKDLADPLIMEMTVEEQFSAFMEAMHIVNIRVLIDIITRTVSRDNDLVYDKPQWFYWINKNKEIEYNSPRIDGVYENEKPTLFNIEKVYKNNNVKKHISLFCNSPDIIDKNKFEEIKNRVKKGDNILSEIEKEFEITTAPAFSDCINDKQPPWEDVTYLRLYLDNPKETQQFSKEYKIPYLLFDTIKCDRFKGEVENIELWSILEDIIPYYQNMFGIDGARIDMGHALPERLLYNMLKKAREIDNNFAFIGEELEFNKGEDVYNQGFNIMMGSSFVYETSNSSKLIELINIAKRLPVEFCAASETPDTKRTISKYGNERLLKLLLVFNFFVPNGVPFLNNGIELGESQPMNLGLGCVEEDKYINLTKEDKYYGKLAFFDLYEFHWLSKKRRGIMEVITNISEIRNKYIDTITNVNNFYNIISSNKNIIVISYILNKMKYKEKENILMVLLNINMDDVEEGIIDLDYIRKESWNSQRKANIIYTINNIKSNSIIFNDKWNIELRLLPGECEILII